jgi:hypothetical protein
MEDPRIIKCLMAKRESKAVEFKEQFLPSDPHQSLEILKDIVAIANSGGGTLAVGINNAGEASGSDVQTVLDYDHAKYCDLIRKYTLQNFCDFEIIEAEKNGQAVAIFLINPPDYPLVFEKPGTYAVENNRQQTVFSQGTIYFRHGAKTESGTTEDLRKFMLLRIREMQNQLVKGLRKVSESPRGSQLQVTPLVLVEQSQASVVPFRMTTNPNAQGVIAVDRHRICPYRQKEVLQKLKERLPDGPSLNGRDIQAINKVYGISSKEEFAWEPEFSSRQYSQAFIDWIVEMIQNDVEFLPDTRRRYYEITHPDALPFD